MIQNLVFWLFLAIFSVPWPVSAQEYHWRKALPGNWHSVAFNPRSHGKVIFVGSAGGSGIFRSDDGGLTWASHNAGPTVPPTNIHQMFCVAGDTSSVLAITPNQLYYSSNGGLVWNDTLSLGGVDGESISYHPASDAVYYGRSFAQGVWKSRDHGLIWTQVGVGSADSIGLCALDVSPDLPPILIQGSELQHGLLAHSADEGASWLVTFRGNEQQESEVPKVVFSWHAVNPITQKHSVAVVTRWPVTRYSLLSTIDGGDTWLPFPNVPSRAWALDIDQRQSMVSKPSDPAYPKPLHFFTGLFNVAADTIPNGLVQETLDGGITWHSMNFPYASESDTAHQIWVLKYDTLSARIAVATDVGVFIGDTATPALVLPTSVDFGSVSVGANRTKSILLQNPGNTDVTVQTLSISPSSSSFTTLGIAPFTILAGGSKSIDVAFGPASLGVHTATLLLSMGADNVEGVLLQGIAESSGAVIGNTDQQRALFTQKHDLLIIESSDFITDIQLYDILGRKVKEQPAWQQSIGISTANLQRGLYVATVALRNGSTVQQLLQLP
jgi:hypothetical protein